MIVMLKMFCKDLNKHCLLLIKNIMKRFLFTIAFVLSTLPVLCQTAIFNHYRNRPGVQASVIKNYDIGNHNKVTVTMLEAADKATYIELKEEIKSMGSVDKKGNSPDTNKTPFNIGKVNSLTMNVSVVNKESGTSSTHSPYHQVDIQSIAPFPGDVGEYLVCGSDKTMTILVFHCPDHDTYQRIMKYVLINSIRK